MFKRRIILLLACLGLSAGLQAADVRLEAWSEDLHLPWSIAFLPDGSALVTELSGTLRRLDAGGRKGPAIENVPAVYFAGQGGLFDVLPDPAFAENGVIYLSYAEGSPRDNGTAIARARLDGDRLADVEVIFRNFSRKDTPVHYGGRMAFLADGSLLLTTGDGFDYREAAQDVLSGLGKVLRMNPDGTPASGNPFPESPYVYSYGHRNPQGLAVSSSGDIWLHEHGPRGGDELNRIEPGANYGWPAATHGKDYSGAVISPFTELEGIEPPARWWTPSIAPSGLAVYQADLFAAWKGDLLLGALVDREVRRIEFNAGKITGEESLFGQLDARIRDVRVGPGGALFILTPDSVFRATPGKE